MNSIKKNTEVKGRIVKLQSENGVLRITASEEILSELKNTEYLWSHSIKSLLVQGVISNTDRIACNLINTLLHRDVTGDNIKLRTLADLVERVGTDYKTEQENWADEVLREHNWNVDTGLPSDEVALPLSKNEPAMNITKSDPRIAELIKEINDKRENEERIPNSSEKIEQIESTDAKTVKICIDGVLSKRQKTQRGIKEENKTSASTEKQIDYSRAPEITKRPSVENAVAHIEADGKKYAFVAMNMFVLSKMIIAFLLANNLIIDRTLVFFVDGGKDIRKCINELFNFCPKIVVLDWYHLRKHCYEYLSLALKGGKKNRAIQYEVRRRLFRILWTGNVDGAIKYLNSLDADWIKQYSRMEELIAYLKRKEPDVACYALRRKLGLQISSNRVEMVNNKLVSKRQKGKGMSWSRDGSQALANATAMYLNKEEENWFEQGIINRVANSKFGNIFENKAA